MRCLSLQQGVEVAAVARRQADPVVDRRCVLVGLLAAPRAWAQPAAKLARIGVLVHSGNLQVYEELRGALRDLGWVEGRNLIIERRLVDDSPQRARELAAELQGLPVALILASGTTMIRSARDGAPATPIVMINAGDALGSGFIASLRRPGGNLTGTTAAGEEVLAKQLELLSLAAPQAKTIGVLLNRANPANGFFFNALSARARELGLQLARIEIDHVGELDAALLRAKGTPLLIIGDPVFNRERARIAELSISHRVPGIFGAREYVAAGGLMFYNSSYAWHWRTAAAFVDKLLKGAKPSDLPVQQPTQFELAINLKTAKAMGITIPLALLQRATEVVE
jgi:putative ABC transport system substrate-binding protein